MAEAEEKKQAAGEAGEEGGVVLMCGATDWYSIGRTKDVRAEYPNLPVPHRLKALQVRRADQFDFGWGARARPRRPTPTSACPLARHRERRASRWPSSPPAPPPATPSSAT